jgi:hypothetical protein
VIKVPRGFGISLVRRGAIRRITPPPPGKPRNLPIKAAVDVSAARLTEQHTRTRTHAHTDTEREREREREGANEISRAA